MKVLYVHKFFLITRTYTCQIYFCALTWLGRQIMYRCHINLTKGIDLCSLHGLYILIMVRKGKALARNIAFNSQDLAIFDFAFYIELVVWIINVGGSLRFEL